MKQSTIILIALTLCMHTFSQSKHTFSLGHGTEKLFNGMVTPYNLNGSEVISFNYGNEKLIKREWKSFFDASLSASSFRVDYDFVNKKNEGKRYSTGFDAFINQSFLKKLVEADRFTAHLGPITSLQGFYQITDYTSILYQGDYATDFLQLGLSGGISTSLQLKLKKVILQNNTSYLLVGAILYPNYTSDSPFYNGTGDYLTFATVNKRNHLENRFKVEFPMYIKDKFINSFSLYHDFKYEYSIIKDNTFRRVVHSINLGIIFKIDKLNVVKEW